MFRSRIKVTSTVALHLRWISRKPLEIEVWFQRTTNRKWHMGYRMVTWPMTSHDLERSNSWPQYAKITISRKLLELETSNLVCSFLLGMSSRHTNKFPESGRGLGHTTPTIFGSTVGYPIDSLASCFIKVSNQTQKSIPHSESNWTWFSLNRHAQTFTDSQNIRITFKLL